MDIVAVLTTVTEEQSTQLSDQKTKMTEQSTQLADQKTKMIEKDAEIADLKDRILQIETSHEERMLQMEMALAEVLRNQSSVSKVVSID